MSQSAYTIRLDSDLKNRFDTLCEGFGMSASTAFNIFVRTVVRKRRIPFEIEMSEKDAIHEEGRKALLEIRKMAEQGAFPDLTLDEINEEIRLARESKWAYEVALSKEDTFLVTGNIKHFPKVDMVVTPAEMMEIIKRNMEEKPSAMSAFFQSS